MELILISSNKLKIILTKEEMKKYKLSADTDVSHIYEKKQFCVLLDEVKKRSGFDIMSDSIYVELFESLRGGCEIFITREGLSKSKHLPQPKFKKEMIETIITYKFARAEDLILAAKRLSTTPIVFESRLFSDENESFYLFLTSKEGYSADSLPLIFLEEYGTKVKSSDIRLHLDEHGHDLISKNAVNVLAQL